MGRQMDMEKLLRAFLQVTVAHSLSQHITADKNKFACRRIFSPTATSKTRGAESTDVHFNITLRRVRATVVTVEK